ncbi:MAG: SGNH/GDSL hydrolase family protein [Cyanobacteriota bacterium]
MKNILLRFIQKLNFIWMLLGVTLILFFLVNFFASCILVFISDNESYKQVDKYNNLKTYCYSGSQWVDEYLTELYNCSKDLKWVSYVYWRRQKVSGKHINIDKYGHRKTWKSDTKISNPVNQKEIKIFLLGGSTMWGEWARDDYTIPSELAKLLYNNRIKARVINLSESGYNSTQELIVLVNEIQKGNIPDIVIFYDGINDTFSAIQSNKAGIPLNESNREKAFELEKNIYNLTTEYYKNLIKQLSIYKLILVIKSKLVRPQSPDKFIYENTLSDEVVKTYSSNVNIIENISNRYNFKLLFYWQPIIFRKDKLTTYEKIKAKDDYRFEKFYKSVYEAVDKSKVLNSNQNFYNLSKIFINKENTVFIDVCHVTEEGNLIIAEKMYLDIKDVINKPSMAK